MSLLLFRGDEGLNVKPAPSGDETPYRYSINGSRDVIGHAFDPKAMEAVVRGLVAEAVIADAPFVVQSEWEELCIADRARGYWWRPLRLLMQAYHGMLPRRVLRRWLLERMTVYWSVEEWLDAMREVDCVIGTRLHGSIAALLAGTPSLLIVHDTRTEEVARHFALPSVRLDEIGTVRLDELAQMADPAPAVKRYRELLPEFNRFLRQNGLEPSASDEVRPSAAGEPMAPTAGEPEPASGSRELRSAPREFRG